MAGTQTESAPATAKASAGTMSKKGKRQIQFHDEARPKKLAHREPTTEGILQKAKDLKKHRQSLPIFTGKNEENKSEEYIRNGNGNWRLISVLLL